MNNKNLWFYIEPYVYISISGPDALLYNTVNSKFLIFKNKPEVSTFLRKLKSQKNLLVIKLDNDYKNRHPWLPSFINKVKKLFMGDTIESECPKKKPFQTMPVLSIYKDIPRLKKEKLRSVGEGIKSYLSEISLYLNGNCSQQCPNCQDSYKQFPYCHKDRKKSNRPLNNELSLDKIEKIIEETNGTSLKRIHLLGGNLLDYSNLNQLISILNRIPVTKIYYLHILNFPDNTDSLKSFDQKSSVLNLLISFPLEEMALEKAFQSISNMGLKTVFSILVQDQNEFEYIQAFIAKYKIDKLGTILFQPYFNGNNLYFFKRHVFVERKKILGTKISQNDLFMREKINPSNFGKIVIANSGDIYSNMNTPKLGDVKKNSLYEILSKEILSRRSWRRLRSDVTPCNRCVYQLFCPPLSNYEYAIGRNSICK